MYKGACCCAPIARTPKCHELHTDLHIPFILQQYILTFNFLVLIYRTQDRRLILPPPIINVVTNLAKMKLNSNGSHSFGTLKLSDSDMFPAMSINSYFTDKNYDSFVNYFSNRPGYNYNNPIDYIPLNTFETPNYILSNTINNNSTEWNSLSNILRSHFNSNDPFDMTQLNIISQLLDTTQQEDSNDYVDNFFNVSNDYSNGQRLQNVLNNELSCNPISNNSVDYTIRYTNQLDKLGNEVDNSYYINNVGNTVSDGHNKYDHGDEVYEYDKLEHNYEDFVSYDVMADYCTSDDTFFARHNGENLQNLSNIIANNNGVDARRKNMDLNKDEQSEETGVSDIYVSWIPKNARCKLVHELPDTVEECEKYPEYVAARDKMLVVLQKLGFFHVESITFHPPRGSHIIIRFLNKNIETIFLQRYKDCPHQWKLDMHKYYKFSKKVIGYIKNLRVDTVNKRIKSRLTK